MQQLGRVRHCEQGAGFGVALTQRCVADFVALVLRRDGLELAYTALDVLIVSHDLGDSQRPGFVDCWGFSIDHLVSGDARLTSICHGFSFGWSDSLARHRARF